MGTNLDYLNPDLVPLEQSVTAFLEAEEELRRAEVEARSLEAGASDTTLADPQDLAQRIRTLQARREQLSQEIMQLLPTRDEWVKINLGYGPSRVGAFRLDHPHEGQPEYMVRVVH
jgi:hypothetical protein